MTGVVERHINVNSAADITMPNTSIEWNGHWMAEWPTRPAQPRGERAKLRRCEDAKKNGAGVGWSCMSRRAVNSHDDCVECSIVLIVQVSGDRESTAQRVRVRVVLAVQTAEIAILVAPSIAQQDCRLGRPGYWLLATGH